MSTQRWVDQGRCSRSSGPPSLYDVNGSLPCVGGSWLQPPVWKGRVQAVWCFIVIGPSSLAESVNFRFSSSSQESLRLFICAHRMGGCGRVVLTSGAMGWVHPLLSHRLHQEQLQVWLRAANRDLNLKMKGPLLILSAHQTLTAVMTSSGFLAPLLPVLRERCQGLRCDEDILTSAHQVSARAGAFSRGNWGISRERNIVKFGFHFVESVSYVAFAGQGWWWRVCVLSFSDYFMVLFPGGESLHVELGGKLRARTPLQKAKAVDSPCACIPVYSGDSTLNFKFRGKSMTYLPYLCLKDWCCFAMK